jgi:xanthine dehydrogenase YagS FAD-binding subunit
MRPFHYERAENAPAAVTAATAARMNADAPATLAPRAFLAGGTTLLDLMKLDVMRPETLIDVNGLAQSDGDITEDDEGLHLGAFVRMAEAAASPVVRDKYPVIAETLTLAASQQLRNMATLGGNILQRTRCPYFRDMSWQACNKRNPGSGCAAMDGHNRTHAILGTSDACIATYPGDFAQALIALDAELQVTGPGGARRMKFSALHRQPGKTPDRETTLKPAELITRITVPAGPWTKRSLYLKVRDRESYEFALTSAAVALDLADGKVRAARIALGGVATVPWRAAEAENALRDKLLDEATATTAADIAFATAKPREKNRFKVALGKRTLVRALLQAARMEA